jgi:maltooligosyltrehalose trehalohydrolase
MIGRFGPLVTAEGTLFRLWAPKAEVVRLEVDGADAGAMNRGPDGWHRLLHPAGPGSRYRFVLPDGLKVPDPASRFQPEGVHGPSEVVAPLPPPGPPWAGRPWEEVVLYELHVGTFTPEGTFRAAIERLPHLADIGVTAVEIMPVAAFPGERNWGYDGVLLFAPAMPYGRPEDLKALVDAAHGHGMAVLLDVVYNHFGPEGNYLPLYAPLFNEVHETPWGAAVNFDAEGREEVRAFAVENALYWLEHYGFDGLRLDAVHEIRDHSANHILAEIAAAVARLPSDRPLHLIVENEDNEPAWLRRDYRAQWNDDVHHGLHVAVTGEAEGYYGDYAGRADRLARALAEGFAFQGEPMPYRGSERGAPCRDLSPTAFVAFLQNHDQIGNRAFGDRIAHGADAAAVRAATAAFLLSPQIPLLFQGEEWGASAPFQFFCDLGDDLKDAVRDGRRAEFKRFSAFADPEKRAAIPDPTARETFLASKLDWSERTRPPHAETLAWYRRILAVRRERIVPLLATIDAGDGTVTVAGVIAVTWESGDSRLSLLLNLSDETRQHAEAPAGDVLWSEGSGWADGQIGPWSALWSIERA